MLEIINIHYTLLYFIFFMFGASIASFICLIIGRGGFRESIVGRSKCGNCGWEIGVFQNIPVFSYIFLKGKCKSCHAKIKMSLFISELFLGFWFLFSILNAYDFIFLFLQLLLGIVFLILVYEDMKSMLVRSRTLYLLVSVGIFGAIYTLLNTGDYNNIYFAVLFSLPFWLIYLINRNAVGEADPYVFTALNLFFGSQFSISLFLYSVWFGTIYGVYYIYFVNKKVELGIKIPFLPIIFFATLFILATDLHIIKMTDILLINEFIFQ